MGVSTVAFLILERVCPGRELAFRRRIRYEEALLVKTLPGYQAYMSRTDKLLPGIF